MRHPPSSSIPSIHSEFSLLLDTLHTPLHIAGEKEKRFKKEKSTQQKML
jgi:hypothetical protein